MTQQDGGGIGLTHPEVQKLSLKEEYELFQQRYARAGELLADAQRVVYAGEWEWPDSGTLPRSGLTTYPAKPLSGADGDNSYMLEISRVFRVAEKGGSTDSMVSMRNYFAGQGWEVIEHGTEGKYTKVIGYTPDGYIIYYKKLDENIYVITAYSQLFWTNDEADLRDAIVQRDGGREALLSSSLPGVYMQLAPWDAPLPEPTEQP